MKENINYGTYVVFELKKATGTKIITFEPPTGEYKKGEVTTTKVTIKNIEHTDRTFWVGLTFFDGMEKEYDTPPKSTTLKLGESAELTFTWKVPSEAIEGRYDAATAIWEGYDLEENIMTGALYDEKWKYDVFWVIEDHKIPEIDIGALLALISDFFEAIIGTISELVTSLQQKPINVPPEEKARENVKDALGALAGMADAYSGFMGLISDLAEVEPPRDAEVKFESHVLSARFCNNIAEAQTYMSSGVIKSADMNEALELVRELELAKKGFCIVIVDYSFMGFGEYESGRYPIVCNEKGDPFWESWQFYEMIKEEIEAAYKEYK